MRHAVVLAGGQGTRLWPFSTAGRPKQLVPLLDGRSLLDAALERGAAIAGEQVWLATGSDLIRAAGGAITGVDPSRTLVEPSGRDTLAALCLAMHAIRTVDPDAVVAVLTADHVITPLDAVVEAFGTGFALAESDDRALVTFGVVADHAATGYGWLELAAASAASTDSGGRRVSAFREKPPLADAEQMHAAGPTRFLWNSGMFVWRAGTLLDAAQRYSPEHVAAAAPLDANAWEALPKRSVDHAVMEPASAPGSGFHVLAVPLAADWRDVGSWTSFADLVGRDAAGNALAARTVVLDADSCVVASDDPEHLVALLGVEGLVVVHTAEATLVCRADDVQRVKELHALIARAAPDRA